MTNVQGSEKSSSGKPQRIEGLDAARTAVLGLAQAADHELAILSHELEPLLYDNADFYEAVSRIARSGRHARVRILVRDHDQLIRHGHHLLRLAQQVPSYVSLRRVAPQHRNGVHGFLITDDGVFYQPLTDSFEAQTSAHARRWARDLGAEFQRLWDHATDDPDLRRLALIG